MHKKVAVLFGSIYFVGKFHSKKIMWQYMYNIFGQSHLPPSAIQSGLVGTEPWESDGTGGSGGGGEGFGDKPFFIDLEDQAG